MEKLNKIISGIQAIVALVIIGAVKIWAKPCSGLLELTNGREIPMKCVHTSNAAMAVGIIILATAIISFLAKSEQKKFYILNGVNAILLYLLFTSIIGICMKPDMACHTTAPWAKVSAVLIVVASLVGILAGKEGQLPE